MTREPVSRPRGVGGAPAQEILLDPALGSVSASETLAGMASSQDHTRLFEAAMQFELSDYLTCIERFFGAEVFALEYQALAEEAQARRKEDSLSAVMLLRRQYLKMRAILGSGKALPGGMRREYILSCFRLGIAAPLPESERYFPEDASKLPMMYYHAATYASSYAKSYALRCLVEEPELSPQALAERVQQEFHARPEIMNWEGKDKPVAREATFDYQRLSDWAAGSAVGEFDPDLAKEARRANTEMGKKSGAKRTARAKAEKEDWLGWRSAFYGLNFENLYVRSEVAHWNRDHPDASRPMTLGRLRSWHAWARAEVKAGRLR